MERRLQQATSACGGSSASIAWRFPLRQPGVQQSAKQFLDGWDRANDGHGYDRLIEHIVGRIRQWRPEVVIASSPSSSSVDPLEQLIGQSVLQAVDYAADSTRYSHQLIDVGLMPWQVRKVYAALPEGERGTLEVVCAQIATRLGNSLSDISSGPCGLLNTGLQSTPASSSFRLLVDRSAQSTGQQDFFSGISALAGRRRPSDATRSRRIRAWQSTPRSSSQNWNLQSILARVDDRGGASQRLSAELSDVTRSMNEDQAAEVLNQLAAALLSARRVGAGGAKLLDDCRPLSKPSARGLGTSVVDSISFQRRGSVAQSQITSGNFREGDCSC